jgi:hypothetical protein
MSDFETWVDQQESQTIAAQLLGRSQGTISKWIAAGEVPGESVPEVSTITGIERKDLNARLYA